MQTAPNLQQEDHKKTRDELLKEKFELSLYNKRINYELDTLKRQFREKVDEGNALWVRDLDIEDVLKGDDQDSVKLEKIQKLMDAPIRTTPIGDEAEMLKILVENNRINERCVLLEQEMDELKQQHALEVEKLKNELKKATPPPVPPRRYHPTNPFANAIN